MAKVASARGSSMPKPFTVIVPASMKPVSDAYHFSPAVRIGDQIHVSGIIGVDAQGRLPADFRGQVANIFAALETILGEAGATLDDVASLTCFHAGDLESQLSQFAEVQAARLGAPNPAVTGVRIAQLGLPGALLEMAAIAVVRD
jgi:enamine deaminase RidA (YjgF/YER057c/UK114 family)